MYATNRTSTGLSFPKRLRNQTVTCLRTREESAKPVWPENHTHRKWKQTQRNTHVCNTLDDISLKLWLSTDILRALTWTVCVCLILQAKQALIHLNKRVVQPAMAALRTGSEEWDCISKRPQRDRVQAVVQKRKFTFQANPFVNKDTAR